MRAVLTILLLFAMMQTATAEPIHPYVSYDLFETRRTESDHRECITQIFLTADDYVGYRYREDVFGSITPVVKSIDFSNEYRRKVTADERADLVHKLLSVGVFELASEPRPAKADYYSILRVCIEPRDKEFFFYSPPHSLARKDVHDIILQFAQRMKVAQPTDPAKVTAITEGDHQPTQAVKLADVIAHPDEYQGNRISIVGFYHGEFEGSSLSVDQTASRNRDYKHSIWLGGMSTFADQSAINVKNDAWLHVEGVFLRGPGGHMGLWPGAVDRLTRIEPVAEPK